MECKKAQSSHRVYNNKPILNQSIKHSLLSSKSYLIKFILQSSNAQSKFHEKSFQINQITWKAIPMFFPKLKAFSTTSFLLKDCSFAERMATDLIQKSNLRDKVFLENEFHFL